MSRDMTLRIVVVESEHAQAVRERVRTSVPLVDQFKLKKSNLETCHLHPFYFNG
jgi:hypothetical protein